MFGLSTFRPLRRLNLKRPSMLDDVQAQIRRGSRWGRGSRTSRKRSTPTQPRARASGGRPQSFGGSGAYLGCRAYTDDKCHGRRAMTTATEAVRGRAEASTGPDPIEHWEVIVIGAGLSGMYQLHRLRELGFKVHVYEAADGVGGTWYWNRYPGARFDSESWTYGFSFSDELLREWDWAEHFSSQPENLRYCDFVADKFDLRRDITFRARAKSAGWDDAANAWEVNFEDGRRARARFLITAIGPLSAPTMPVIEGVDSFRGEAWHTGLWPHEAVSFAGKRVAVIGTGASGVQVITEIAKTVDHLTVFQRTPNWCAPLRNSRIDAETMGKIRATYAEIFARCRETYGCFIHAADPRNAVEVSDEDREAFYERL